MDTLESMCRMPVRSQTCGYLPSRRAKLGVVRVGDRGEVLTGPELYSRQRSRCLLL